MTTIDFSRPSEDFKRIEKAIRFIEENFKQQPGLDQMAQSVHLSKYHFDRMFKRWAGVSPIQFMQFMTLDFTKKRLSEANSILETALDAGLSGPGRLHDLFITFEAMTPGEFKRQGQGLTVTYGFCDSPFGECLLATTRRGICYLGFVDAERRSDALGQLTDTWPNATFAENPTHIIPIAEEIFGVEHRHGTKPFNLLIRGTNFQVNVWKALMNIPKGYIVSYQDIASCIGRPKAFRAVANAIAINPVAYLIPCHRVIAKSGKIHRYRWGSARKKAILGWEAANRA